MNGTIKCYLLELEWIQIELIPEANDDDDEINCRELKC
jgi:hypothetical protein